MILIQNQRFCMQCRRKVNLLSKVILTGGKIFSADLGSITMLKDLLLTHTQLNKNKSILVSQ